MQLVKETRKDWRCSLCLSVIKKGSPMLRKSSHWATKQFCLDCGKSMIDDIYNDAVKAFKMFDTPEYRATINDPNSAYNMFKGNFLYFKKVKEFLEVQKHENH